MSRCSTFYQDGVDDNKTRETLHESGLFYVKGKGNKYNGIVLNKIVASVLSINLLNEDGEYMVVPWKVFYFGENDSNKEIEVITKDGKRVLYVFERGKIQRKESIFEYMARVYN